MNIHHNLYSPAVAFASPYIKPAFEAPEKEHLKRTIIADCARSLNFREITPSDMPDIWEILKSAPGRTTDFSYGGLLMWVSYFRYEFAIIRDTLFIKGRVESDLSRPAFSVPIGRMPLDFSIEILKEYCKLHNMPLILSAVPAEYMPELHRIGIKSYSKLSDWSDYLYSAESLSTLSGKKYGKKRNHVNQFISAYPVWSYEPLTPENCDEVMRFMDAIDAEGDSTPMAVVERSLNRKMLGYIKAGDSILQGGLLRDGAGNILAFAIGDIKGDTLFVHIEKALREAPGAFEMINKTFAAKQMEANPEILYINREDDSGDEGLRKAKESYHPIELLQKFNVEF